MIKPLPLDSSLVIAQPLKQLVSASPVQRIKLIHTSMDCRSVHQRGLVSEVSEGRNSPRSVRDHS